MGADQGFSDWRLIPHRDTDNDHAHVLAFADRYMRRDEFLAWRKQLVARIQGSEQQVGLSQQQWRDRKNDRGADL